MDKMTEQLARKCVVCGTEFESSDRRKTYCKPSCRQEAHRQRHDLKKPDFLVTTNHRDENRRKSHKTVNPAYSAKVREIDQLEGRLSLLRVNRDRVKMEEVKIINQDPSLFATLSTAALAAGAAVGMLLIGYIAAKDIKDKDRHDNTRMMAFLVGMGLAAFLAIATHGGTADKSRQRKIDRIGRLKADSDRLDLEIQSVESLLTVHRAELLSISATVSEEVEIHPLTDVQPSEGVITVTGLREMTFDLLTIGEEYSRLFGQPERGFAMAITGAPGNGKSTYTTQLAYDLATRNGDGIYFSAEEGFSQSLQSKVKDLSSDCLLFSNYKTLSSISEELKRRQYAVVVLDSIQQMGISAVELVELRNRHPSTSFIYILQARKDGTFKGDNRFAHDADIQIKLDGYKPKVEKTRFVLQ